MPRRPQSKKTAYDRSREYKIRLPEDIAARIQRRAEDEGRPQNRIIINQLAEYPDLKKTGGQLGESLQFLDQLLLKYSARLTWQELSEELLSNIDEALDAKVGTAQHDIAMDKIRAVRNAMQKYKAGDSK